MTRNPAIVTNNERSLQIKRGAGFLPFKEVEVLLLLPKKVSLKKFKNR